MHWKWRHREQRAYLVGTGDSSGHWWLICFIRQRSAHAEILSLLQLTDWSVIANWKPAAPHGPIWSVPLGVVKSALPFSDLSLSLSLSQYVPGPSQVCQNQERGTHTLGWGLRAVDHTHMLRWNDLYWWRKNQMMIGWFAGSVTVTGDWSHHVVFIRHFVCLHCLQWLPPPPPPISPNAWFIVGSIEGQNFRWTSKWESFCSDRGNSSAQLWILGWRCQSMFTGRHFTVGLVPGALMSLAPFFYLSQSPAFLSTWEPSHSFLSFTKRGSLLI